GRAPVPIWLIILMFLLLYWAMVYFDSNCAWFDQRVYTPYHSFQEVDDMWPKSGGAEGFAKGKPLFSTYCAVCHMENGAGDPSKGCPPLADSEWIKTPGPGRIIRIASKGLAGPIEVKGKLWNTGNTMTPVGDGLMGDEKQKAESLAAIVSY